MIQPTLHGFVILDVIFGIASVVLIGACDVVAHHKYGAFSEMNNRVSQPTIAAKGSAPAIGAGKRALNVISVRHNIVRKALIKTRLAIDRLC